MAPSQHQIEQTEAMKKLADIAEAERNQEVLRQQRLVAEYNDIVRAMKETNDIALIGRLMKALVIVDRQITSAP